ncbi:peptidase C14 [Rubrivivax gelatinosus]|uniref:Peptidase C14 n=1 Tax=Rubrivivax gelatinosus TaxID=28068 RepID=A0ABS1DYI9_RUBGE|nr:caspase family protein [Rubrivivax gelatinosus]MBK1614581.1 peptidase C14 [Rubrivivax gelatinosus]MBK1714809.1 peptidase C14 [Rubrivivax gelatinosus]
MAKRALCVGINQFRRYPQFQLNGCVNDAQDMAALLTGTLGWRESEITLLLDKKATKAAILARLRKLVDQAKAGKIGHIVFSWSSHGTQVADTSGDEPDGVDEAFVPYDVAEKDGDWDPEHIIVDDELHDLFAELPPTVLLEVFLDTCHSGTGLRGAEFSLHAPRPRFVAPPSRQGTLRQRDATGFVLGRDAGQPGEHHVLWTGCKANQTSADAYFDGRYNGAFTYYFVKATQDGAGQHSRDEVLQAMRLAMKGQFSQVPQLETRATNRTLAVAH